MKKSVVVDRAEEAPVTIRLAKSQGRFKRIRNPEGRDRGVGEFFMEIEVSAHARDVYMPLSIASSKKPTGFVYQIEGSGVGTIVSATIESERGAASQVTLGTIVYCKIPKGTTVVFRILIAMEGFVRETFQIVIHRINFKLNPTDARYGKRDIELRSRSLKLGR